MECFLSTVVSLLLIYVLIQDHFIFRNQSLLIYECNLVVALFSSVLCTVALVQLSIFVEVTRKVRMDLCTIQFVLTFLWVQQSYRLIKRSIFCVFLSPQFLLSKQYWLFDLVGLFTCSPGEAWWWVYRAQESFSPAWASGSLSGGCSFSSVPAGTLSGQMWSDAYSSQLPHHTCRKDRTEREAKKGGISFTMGLLQHWMRLWNSVECTPWPFYTM